MMGAEERMGVCRYPYLDIQAQQRRIPLPVKHPKSLQIPNSEQNKKTLSMPSDCITPPLSPGLKDMSPNSYMPPKAKQMFPNAQIPAACEVAVICYTTKERRAAGLGPCLRICAAEGRDSDGETCS